MAATDADAAQRFADFVFADATGSAQPDIAAGPGNMPIDAAGAAADGAERFDVDGRRARQGRPVARAPRPRRRAPPYARRRGPSGRRPQRFGAVR